MGWKSTKDLTREDAEHLYFKLKSEKRALKKGYRVAVSDGELENRLDRLADEIDSLGGGHSGHNYRIVGEVEGSLSRFR